MLRRYLLGTVSYSTMALAVMINQEIVDRKSSQFLEYRNKAQKSLLNTVIFGKPYQPMFRPTHFVKPDNWDSSPKARDLFDNVPEPEA